MLGKNDRTITPFRPFHLGYLGEVGETAKWIGATGPAWTGFAGYELVAIGGISILWQGVGEAYIFGTDRKREHRLWFTKQVIQKLNLVVAEMKLHRVQAAVHADDKVALDWILQKRLGFEVEGVMMKYGPDGADYIRVAKVM